MCRGKKVIIQIKKKPGSLSLSGKIEKPIFMGESSISQLPPPPPFPKLPTKGTHYFFKKSFNIPPYFCEPHNRLISVRWRADIHPHFRSFPSLGHFVHFRVWDKLLTDIPQKITFHLFVARKSHNYKSFINCKSFAAPNSERRQCTIKLLHSPENIRSQSCLFCKET